MTDKNPTSPTEEKPTGARAAAWEITDLIDLGFVTQHRNKKHDAIEAIIKQHCPKDKGEAIEGKYRADFLWGYDDGSPESIGYEFCNARNERYRQIQWEAFVKAIISKYCPEDKAVKLVEAARNVVLIFETEAKTYEAMAMVMKLKTAIAEYEKVKK